MKKKRQREPEQIQYRIRFRLDAEVIPVERYFMATSSEQALEMFAYSCRSSQPGPELLDFAKWNRWKDEWIFEITKEAAQELLQSLAENQNSPKAESEVVENADNNNEMLNKLLASNQERYDDPRFYIHGKPNPKYKQEIERIKKLLNK